jgi:hypothetical protein
MHLLAHNSITFPIPNLFMQQMSKLYLHPKENLQGWLFSLKHLSTQN